MGQGLPAAHVVTSAIEHSSVLNACKFLQEQGIRVTYLPAGWDGCVNPRQFESAMDSDTVLVSVMLANNDTGAIQPVAEIARFAHERDILVHTDAVQAFGRIPLSVQELDVDFLSLSAHKFRGPRGIGVLYVKDGEVVTPLLRGGKQELSRRAGTENLPAIVGMALAAELACAELTLYAQHCQALRARLEQGVLARIPTARIHAELAVRVPNTVSIGFPGVDGMALMLNMDLEGIAISVGSACGAGDHEPNHVLVGMGCTEEDALSVVRISLGLENTEAEIEATLAALERVVPRLQGTNSAKAAHR